MSQNLKKKNAKAAIVGEVSGTSVGKSARAQYSSATIQRGSGSSGIFPKLWRKSQAETNHPVRASPLRRSQGK